MLASMQHLLLHSMGHRPRFEVTMRVAFFSIVAQSIAIVPIPGLSLFAAEAYTVAIQTVGFKKVYRLRTTAALIVSIVPFLILKFLPACMMGW
jgi:hypothetical protein